MRRRERRRQRIKRRIYATAAAISLAAIASVFCYAASKDGGIQEPVAAENLKAIDELTTTMEQFTAAPEPTGAALIQSMDWDADEAYILAKIAMAEAEGEDTEGKALVILTVLNRVWSPQFPGTIEEVIAEKNAFSSYGNGRYDRVEPDEDCRAALELVQSRHWDGSRGALYFERTPEPGESTWHSRNLETLFIHGNHTFYTEKEERDGD
ncbi:MAG: cell wall hydrolase [Lachnospiraceae bacterium]|nr:cell wall hydrolase [Lachnospiraceae bacterium]